MSRSPALVSSLTALGLIASFSAASAAEVRAATRLTRKVTYSAVSAASIARAVSGRTVEGKITFAPTLGGSPTGSATEACARVKVTLDQVIDSKYCGWLR